MLLHRLQPLLGAARAALQHAQDAVGVAHGGDFRIGDDDRLVGEVERHQRALLDAGRAVADDVVELLASARRAPARRPRGSARPCRASGWSAASHRFSMRLSLISAWFSRASPLITLMKSKTTRRSQPMIRSRLRSPTSKSMTTVLLALQGQPGGERGARRGLADPALAGCHDDDFTQLHLHFTRVADPSADLAAVVAPFMPPAAFPASAAHASGSMAMRSPSRKICAGLPISASGMSSRTRQ